MPTSLHVLIVEDRPDDAELMALELRRAGLAPEWQRVDTEPDFLAALGAKPDIILSDFRLPAFTALDVLQWLQKCKNDTPCIIVTGTLGDEQAVECIKQGAADYLLKDRLALLGRAVEKALAQKNNRTKQERAEHDLVVSERRYRRLFESAKDGILILDYETGHIVDVNPFLTTMLGFSYEEMLGKTLWDIGFARDRIDSKLNFEDLKREGYVRYDDLPLETKDHRTFSVEFISNVYPVDTQNVIQCNIRDITERKRAGEALRESEERFRSAFGHAAIGMALLGIDGRWLQVNQALCDVVGYSEQELLATTFQAISHPDDLESDLNYVRQMLTGEIQYYQMEKRYVHKRGHAVWILLSASLIRNAAGKPQYFLAHIQNITERKRTQETLQKTHDQLTALIQAAPMGIAVLDPDGHVQLWNPAAERIFGWQEAEVLGHPMPTIPPDKQDEHRSFYRQVMDGHAFTGIDVVRQRKDGALVDISLSTAALKDEEGHVVGILGIMADITERKLMERRTGRLEELATMGQLMSGIAHELKNPLFVLSGRLQLISEKLAAREYDTVGTDLKTIEDAAQRMTVITQRFLNFARPHTAQKEQCAINLALKKTVEFLSNELMKSRIQLVMPLGPNLQPVWCDPRDLQQIFTNLILNAIYAMARANGRGTLTILTVPNVAAVEIRIQDDGSGIAPEHCARLFDPFFTTKPADEGTGLGLWIVKSLIIGMHGTIDCESEIGKGTTFVVRLPTLPVQESS